MYLVSSLKWLGRVLARERAYSVSVLLTLALALSVNTTVFSILNAVVLRPLPFPHQGQLVWLGAARPTGTQTDRLNEAELRELRTESGALGTVGGFYDTFVDFEDPAHAERLSAAVVTASTLELLGVTPATGRLFREEDEQPGAVPVVVLGHDLWRRRFGGDSAVIGKTIHLSSRSYTVVGVMPEGIRFPEYAELWTPLRKSSQPPATDQRYFGAVARLAPDATIDQAETSLQRVDARLAAAYPAAERAVRITAEPLRRHYAGDIGRALLLFQVLTLLVLLIACANLASLLLARAAACRPGAAMRRALGASSWRAIEGFVVEVATLAIGGSVVGLAAGIAAQRAIVAALPPELQLPYWLRFDLDWRLIGFILACALGSAVLAGAGAAAWLAATPATDAMRDGSSRTSESPRRHRLRSVLVVAQVAFALMLLSAAAFVTRSFLTLQHVPLGLAAQHGEAFRAGVPASEYSTPAQRRAAWMALVAAMQRASPDAQVAFATGMPLTGGQPSQYVTAAGAETPLLGSVLAVSPTYFSVLGIRMEKGRGLLAGEVDDGSEAVVSASLAARLWPGADPIGRALSIGQATDHTPLLTVVGVANDVRQFGPDQPPPALVYRTLAETSSTLLVAVRVPTAPSEAGIRAAIRKLDATIPGVIVDQLHSYEEMRSGAMWKPRLYAEMLVGFAVVAFALATIGIYGLVAYAVRLRRREIAIRVALGATSVDVLRLFALRMGKLVMAGCVAGLLLFYAAAPPLRMLAPDAQVAHPVVLLVLVILAGTAGMATLLPARAAAAIEPSTALSTEQGS